MDKILKKENSEDKLREQLLYDENGQSSKMITNSTIYVEKRGKFKPWLRCLVLMTSIILCLIPPVVHWQRIYKKIES